MACLSLPLCGTIGAALLGVGFTPPSSDPCVFTRGSDGAVATPTLYVEDILIIGSNPELKRLKAFMDGFTLTVLGEVSLVLVMTVTRNYGEGTWTDTQKYFLEM